MKVSILTPNFSSNCLGRAYLLAQLISKFMDVEIIGPILNNKIWPPLSNQSQVEIQFKPIHWTRTQSFYTFIKKVSSIIEGDILYVSKPMLTSFGVALAIQKQNKMPLILDIDDWDLGFVIEHIKTRRIERWLFNTLPHKFNGYQALLDCYVLEKIAQSMKEEIQITVSNSFLQKKFGGTIIWHTRDENVFDPKRYSSYDSRKYFRIPEDKIVLMFFGTPRPHKGIEELIRAIYITKELRNNQEIVLVIGGVGEDRYSKKIVQTGRRLLGDKVFFIGYIPFKENPKAVIASDIYIIPQKKTHASFGQLPAKLFDAMAMARAIISTDISDIPRILEGVGIIISSEASVLEKSIGEEILYLADNPSEIKKLGKKARKKFIGQYGFDCMRKILSI